MLEKYPQIKMLYGPDSVSWMKVALCFVLQIAACYFVRDMGVVGFLVLAWAWGGTINHSLMLAIHELSHDLMFHESWKNLWFGIFTSLPLSLPISIGFKKYHRIHHSKQGWAGVDPDLPTFWEGRTFQSVPMKILFMFFQPFFYVGRPIVVFPMPMQTEEYYAWAVQIAFDITILHFFGGKALLYLLIGTLLGCGLHPLAAHFVGEHYAWDPRYETYSYYGPLNLLVYNVGWHNEHHDFPQIPGSRLPELHKIAPEFYKDIGVHSSWPMVIWRFITDPTITPFSRVLRKPTKKSLY
uniref:Fatty acid desaturase domain-containing protein n=1 Tax=Arcella intermedia TaxID=1963864 RepID=A0A6B2LB37_9EUKA